MIAQTIELPTISVKRSMEKIVVMIIEIAADSIMVGELSDLENRNIRCQWSTPRAHVGSRQQGIAENCR